MEEREYKRRFAQKLIEARSRLNLTQREAAARIGLTQGGLSPYEAPAMNDSASGFKHTPGAELMHQLADVYGVHEAELLETLGYRVGLEDIDEAVGQQRLREAGVREYLMAQGITNEEEIHIAEYLVSVFKARTSKLEEIIWIEI